MWCRKEWEKMELCEKLYGGWKSSESMHKLGRMFAVLVLFSLLTAFVSVDHTVGVNSLRPESAADLSHKADAKVEAAGGMSVSEGFLPENIADFAVRLEEMIRNSAVLENGRLPAADISLSTAISADTDTVAALSASALPSADRDAGAADDAAVPIIPDEPAVPIVPDEPAVPIVPDGPAVPVVPDGPAVPIVPDEPAVPIVPDEPAVPVVPDEPAVPIVPDEPSAPPANIADETPDAGAEEDALPDSSNPDVPGAVMTTVNGFYVNEAGMICGIADPETAVSDGYAEIPAEGCTGIAAGAFDGSPAGIREIYIPGNITVIEEGALSGLTDMEWIEMESSGEYITIDGVLFSDNGACLLTFPAGRIGSYKVPSQVTWFAADAFKASGLSAVDTSGCSLLDAGNLPGTIQLI